MKGVRLCASIAIFFALLLSCRHEVVTNGSLRSRKQKTVKRYLTAILEVNTPGYFLKGGLPTGYHFEMLRSYALSKGMLLKIIPFTSINYATKYLGSGKADILAVENSSISNSNLQKTVPHWKLRYATISFNKRVMGANDKIYVPNNAFDDDEFYILRRKFPKIVLFDGINMGLLVEHLLNDGNAYAIVQSSVAEATRIKYPDVSVGYLQESISSSWYVAKNCCFLDDLNRWIAAKRNTALHPTFYSSFYQNYKVNRALADGVSMQGEPLLSNYDQEVKRYSKTIGWDWLLVSALIYQESKFEPHVQSGKGAKGLMQVMPVIANSFGFGASHSSKTNIYIGTKLLAKLSKAFSRYPIAIEERNKFVLAAYNGGMSHVLKAMGLASRYGRNPYQWDDVSLFVRVKRNSNVFRRRDINLNLHNNNETTRFVVEVLERYTNYKALTLN
ncbi:transglycosylase SLT domain-containing protein [uncultured Acetobacteroides sp.]|uniref:transglycosylase SLT domain-containing protein n=1 Tax=uncultured Acetobacteroides sp. TaxID=1760811 RepID=UPI0029F45A76|nr:transglycosylase SLT domain-containing protein [uncultured Acetobacteroides sp.]